jgi:hypothetical protein
MVGGWEDVKAVLWITYSNQKLVKYFKIIHKTRTA